MTAKPSTNLFAQVDEQKVKENLEKDKNKWSEAVKIADSPQFKQAVAHYTKATIAAQPSLRRIAALIVNQKAAAASQKEAAVDVETKVKDDEEDEEEEEEEEEEGEEGDEEGSEEYELEKAEAEVAALSFSAAGPKAESKASQRSTTGSSGTASDDETYKEVEAHVKGFLLSGIALKQFTKFSNSRDLWKNVLEHMPGESKKIASIPSVKPLTQQEQK